MSLYHLKMMKGSIKAFVGPTFILHFLLCSSNRDQESWSLCPLLPPAWCFTVTVRAWAVLDFEDWCWHLLGSFTWKFWWHFKTVPLFLFTKRVINRKWIFLFVHLRYSSSCYLSPIQCIILFGSLWLVAMEIISYGNDASVITEWIWLLMDNINNRHQPLLTKGNLIKNLKQD